MSDFVFVNNDDQRYRTLQRVSTCVSPPPARVRTRSMSATTRSRSWLPPTTRWPRAAASRCAAAATATKASWRTSCRGPRQVPCHHRHRPGDGPALQRGRRRVLALECVGALQVLGRRRQPELGRLCEPVQVGQPDPARRLVLFGGRWRPHRRRRLWPAVAPAGPDGRLAVGRGHPGAQGRARTPWSPSTSTWPASAPTATCSSRAVAAVAATTASS